MSVASRRPMEPSYRGFFLKRHTTTSSSAFFGKPKATCFPTQDAPTFPIEGSIGCLVTFSMPMRVLPPLLNKLVPSSPLEEGLAGFKTFHMTKWTLLPFQSRSRYIASISIRPNVSPLHSGPRRWRRYSLREFASSSTEKGEISPFPTALLPAVVPTGWMAIIPPTLWSAV